MFGKTIAITEVKIMARYSVVHLDIRGKDLIGVDNLRNVERNALSTRNVIYIYRGTNSQKIYIGQTGNFMARHMQHYDGNEEMFETSGFDKVIVLFSQYFNRSALDDVESQLITYFNADNPRPIRFLVQESGGTTPLLEN